MMVSEMIHFLLLDWINFSWLSFDITFLNPCNCLAFSKLVMENSNNLQCMVMNNILLFKIMSHYFNIITSLCEIL